MFSYRHAFHAGNHADVLKHITLLALLKYLTQKEALTVIDTHAGAGLYRLDSDHSHTSGEAQEGIRPRICPGHDGAARPRGRPDAAKACVHAR
jgi:23S rRNA (adenine2030-N6)-methyltransferase